MQSVKKTELTVTVLEATEKALKKAGEELGFSIGDVIDRMALNWQSADPVSAAQIILESYIMNTRHLTESQRCETLYFVASVMASCGEDFSVENIQKAISDRFNYLDNIEESVD